MSGGAWKVTTRKVHICDAPPDHEEKNRRWNVVLARFPPLSILHKNKVDLWTYFDKMHISQEGALGFTFSGIHVHFPRDTEGIHYLSSATINNEAVCTIYKYNGQNTFCLEVVNLTIANGTIFETKIQCIWLYQREDCHHPRIRN